jgi:DNA mismatch endonuclease (patch repair protein)
MMAGIKGKNTKPELIIRSGLHRRGFRFRLHAKRLPGRPDLTLSKYNAVIFVHGCFWHGHDCHLFRLPGSRTQFWSRKIKRNQELDEESVSRLRGLNWRVAVIWECALKGKRRLGTETVVLQLENWLVGLQPSLEIFGVEGPE